MRKHKIILILNGLLFCIMVVHIAIGMYLIATDPATSFAPVDAVIFTFYYIIPFISLNVGYVIIKAVLHVIQKRKRQTEIHTK